MTNLFRPLAAAAALLVTLAPAALAGGAHVKVSGPAKDGTYRVHTYACANPAALKVAAWAEGLVDGKRQTVPVSLRKTREKGVYQLARTWPERGTWVLRMEVGDGRLPVTVAAIGADGAVQANRLIWEGDGLRECTAILSGDEGC
jgi:hypothetical protein